MNLRFIGTGTLGSARIRNKLSRDYRRFSTLLIDERILIDPSADIFEFEENFMLGGLYLNATDVLITHSHLDHFSISAIEQLAAKRRITVFCDQTLTEALAAIPNVLTVGISAFSLFRIDDYEILPLPSNHTTDNKAEVAYNFVIQREKTIFYGLDGAWINAESWQILKALKPSCFVLECALANSDYSPACFYHNNLDMVKKIKSIIEEAGALSDGAKFIISHIPTSKKLSIHEELSSLCDECGIKVAYDGYFVSV